MTAIHSASASLLAKRQGREDTLRLLRCQSRSLLHKIDMDGKMKKMAELQLSVIKEQKSRRAVESQVSEWSHGPVGGAHELQVNRKPAGHVLLAAGLHLTCTSLMSVPDV